ncbi:MAG: hypothetical protein PXX73_03530 [Sideroxydans sp.]|nr:hypothetical protein [Sideroxydans sp.]
MRIAHLKSSQRGAALMVMLVIMVVGITAILVSSLNSSAIKIARQNDSSKVLAQAKEALIARATNDANVLGSLPCPDTNNDGLAELLVGNECPSYIGRLPWKTLGIDDLRDGAGERLWYAVSRNFRDDNSNHINSDTQGTLNVTGSQTASQLIAIVFAAGNPVSSQTRSASVTTVCNGVSLTENLCAQNYLEASNALPSNAAAPNNNYQLNAASNLFNDQAIYLTHEQLFPVIEMRIAREVKACLDGYAAGSNNKYPWAVPASVTSFTSTPNTLFGRLPNQPVTAINSATGSQASLIAGLSSAGNAVIQLRNLVASVKFPVDTAGDWAVELSNGQHTPATVQAKLDAALAAVNALSNSSNKTTLLNALNALQTALNDFNNGTGAGTVDNTMLGSWASIPACADLMADTYWADWKNLVFYQISSDHKPGSNTPNACPNVANPNCLRINGQGSYRATVLVARQIISPQNRAGFSEPPTGYLEGGNAHTAVNPANTFTSNRPVESGFTGVNDLVLCLDGQQTCK